MSDKPNVDGLKRYVADRDGNMEPDDRDLSIPAVRADSWVLATECYAAIARQRRIIERLNGAVLEAGVRYRPVLERNSTVEWGWEATMEQDCDGEWVHLSVISALRMGE